MKNLLIAILIIFVFIIIWLIGLKIYYFFQQTSQERFFYKELKIHLKKGEKEIILKNLTNFQWKQAYLLNVYTVFPMENEKLSLPKNIPKYKSIEKLPLLKNEGQWALAFIIDKNRVVHFIRGNSYSILGINNNYFYTEKSKIFVKNKKELILIKE
ncbi:MAG: hypothetical protein WC860_08845 [Candidatus Margulisiibacteriota bacterium]